MILIVRWLARNGLARSTWRICVAVWRCVKLVCALAVTALALALRACNVPDVIVGVWVVTARIALALSLSL